jgi:hypothetical protein
MKINIGDVLITTQQNTILVVDINKLNGMLRGIYSGETEIRNVGYESGINIAVESGHWKHFPVKK